MKIYYYLFLFIISGLFLAACDSTTEPDPVGTTGSIYVQSNPANAQIWVDGTNSGRTTPDSVRNLSSGSHTVMLRLSGYRDTTFTVNVTAGFQRAVSVSLTSDLSVITYGPIRIYETAGTTTSQPSGIDLSEGTAVSSSTDPGHDLYYSSSGFVLRDPVDPSKNTVFYIAPGVNLNDGEDSPLSQNAGSGGWTSQVSVDEDNYFFIFDPDLHYSKMEIVGTGGGQGPGDPAWAEVRWIYNTQPNDRRF